MINSFNYTRFPVFVMGVFLVQGVQKKKRMLLFSGKIPKINTRHLKVAYPCMMHSIFYTKCPFDIKKALKRRCAVLMRFAKS